MARTYGLLNCPWITACLSLFTTESLKDPTTALDKIQFDLSKLEIDVNHSCEARLTLNCNDRGVFDREVRRLIGDAV